MRASWSQRVRGSIMLAACADALGAPYEGAVDVDVAEVRRRLETPPHRLRWTDDTALMLVLADHLTRRQGTVDQDELATEFAVEWSREPDRGYGRAAGGQFARLVSGIPWSRTSTELFDGKGSYGNGAAMRVAPVGLVPGLGLSSVAARARRAAEVTHAHPWAQDGAVAQAVAVAIAARSSGPEPVDADAFLAAIAAHVQTPEFRGALSQVGALTRRGAGPRQVAETVGNAVSAVESVPAALAAFLVSPEWPREVVRFAICMGGDTDTIAAMAAAICGARRGESDVPVLWGLRVESSARIWAVGSALAGLDAGARSPIGRT
ncbi:ADP-ribosylglycohydrolase family protein [Micromonospora tarapacensis]|uniref:ADP-ribosylglycohydrolase family protein n=1 Tax=Micromonospora tarapacensis TaxID=2835305 RepID=UPI002F408E78